MKKILTLLLLVIAVQVFGQTYPVTGINISLPANPDANIANWGSGTTLFTITANAKAVNGRVDGRIQESKILVSIKKGGVKICGSYTGNTAPASNFNTLTKVWSGSNAVSLLGQGCVLPAGEYELTVQFFGNGAAGVAPLSEEKTRTFSIRGNEQQTYQPPQAIVPVDGIVFNETDVKKPIAFRWTPVVPRPQEPVTYRLKVWQLMQGQNGVQAIKVNQPIITKDVDNMTQAVVYITGDFLKTQLLAFVWNVQALTRDGKPIGGNNGTSETFKYNFSQTEDIITSITLVSPANKSSIQSVEKPRFAWRHPVSSGSASYKIKIVEIKGDQSPEVALRTNKPHFEKDSLKELSFQYPSSATFEAGKRYCWAIQAKNNSGVKITDSEINEFVVSNERTPSAVLTLVSPADGSVIPQNQQPKFTWILPAPTPSGPVNYKLKIVEIKGDQSPEEALRTNKPHFERDSLKDQYFQYPSSAPGFVAKTKYVWYVQAIGRDGETVGANNGMSKVWGFSVQSADITITDFSVSCGKVYGSYTYTLNAENSGNNPFNTSSITFTSPGGSITGATFAPSSSNTVINPGSANAVIFTGGFNYSGTYPAVVYAQINGTQLGNTSLTSIDTEVDSIYACICHDCDNAQFSFTPSGITPGANSSQFNLAGNISVSGLPAVYGLEIQVQSYNYSASPTACSNGVTGIEQSGVFLMPTTSINGITSIQMFNETASGNSNNNASKTIKLVSTTAFPNSIPVNLTIGLPGPLAGLNKDCCKMEYNLCIKIKVFHDKEACKSCVFTYCFPSFNN